MFAPLKSKLESILSVTYCCMFLWTTLPDITVNKFNPLSWFNTRLPVLPTVNPIDDILPVTTNDPVIWADPENGNVVSGAYDADVAFKAYDADVALSANDAVPNKLPVTPDCNNNEPVIVTLPSLTTRDVGVLPLKLSNDIGKPFSVLRFIAFNPVAAILRGAALFWMLFVNTVPSNVLLPVTVKLPVINVFELIDTELPLSVILELSIVLLPDPLVNLFAVGNTSDPLDPEAPVKKPDDCPVSSTAIQ